MILACRRWAIWSVGISRALCSRHREGMTGAKVLIVVQIRLLIVVRILIVLVKREGHLRFLPEGKRRKVDTVAG